MSRQGPSRPRGRQSERSFQQGNAGPNNTNGELNAGLVERFGRGSGRRPDQGDREREVQHRPQAVINPWIGRYFTKPIGAGAPKWALRPEVPTVDELLPYAEYPVTNVAWPTADDAIDTNGWGASGTITDENLRQMNASWGDTRPASNDEWAEAKGSGDDWEATLNVTNNDWDKPVAHTVSWKDPAPAEAPTPPSFDKTSAVDEAQAPAGQDSKGKQDASPGDHQLEPDTSSTWNPAASQGADWNSNVDQDRFVTGDPSMIQSDAPRDPAATGPADAGMPDDESFDNVVNVIEGPWSSKQEYLRNHYLLLREDSLRPLRNALTHVKEALDLNEDPMHSNVGIYDQVHVCGITFSGRGLGVRVSFSLGRVGKMIHWAQSKRLMSGSLVILMSPDKATCKVATVAARPLSNLAKSPPEIDLFFSRSEDLEIDCAQEWIMIEERSGFYESGRHTMVALQRMLDEDFPLQEHLVQVQQQVHPPRYVVDNPTRDVSDVMQPDLGSARTHMNVLQPWPENIDTLLDVSQLTALNTILTKRLSLVQGPPGTGKTFVSVHALKILIKNMAPEDPPIIITCQTNHALDQLLLHLADFEPRFVRLGGQTKDRGIIARRTLYELRSEQTPAQGAPFRGRQAMMHLVGQMAKLLGPLIKGPEAKAHNKEVLDLSLLRELGVLTGKQCDLLVKGAAAWITHGAQPSKDEPLMKWIGQHLEPVKPPHHPTLLEYEEVIEGDTVFEDVVEEDAEGVTKDDSDEIERLRGDHYMLGDTWTGKGSNNKAARDSAIANLKKDDMWKIKTAERGNVYRHIQREMKHKIVLKLREMFAKYQACCQDKKISNWESDEGLLKENRIIGMTTTGLSKYRPLIAALKPKVVLIEEAAETLEAPVIAACCESVQHLILVGDHKQLRPHCHVHDLEQEPYHLNISLFERMVNNGVDFSVLKRQRRMKPEIRRLLAPIYGDKIKDHENVRTTPSVPGMGGLTTWFFTHAFNDERDNNSSSYNHFEAQMVFGLVQYLRYNGMTPENITILTLYQGQRKVLARLIREDAMIGNVKLVTVDSYQGEENDVVILSLVRSNSEGKLGFVGVENRVCVALSRAKRGFYIFGNAEMLSCESKLWCAVVKIMVAGKLDSAAKGAKKGDRNPYLPEGRRLGYALPLWCAKHGRMTHITSVEDWQKNVGGCELPCGGKLACGHACTEQCHPWTHDQYSCTKACARPLPCAHTCELRCHEDCVCKICSLAANAANPDYIDPHIRAFNAERRMETDTRTATEAYVNGRRSAIQRRLDEDNELLVRGVGGGASTTTSAWAQRAAGGRQDDPRFDHVYRFTDLRKQLQAEQGEQEPRSVERIAQDISAYDGAGDSADQKKQEVSLLD